MTVVALWRANKTEVAVGGKSVIAMFGPLLGGLIVNPYDALDQGLPVVEVLFVSVTGPAELVANDTTFAIQPGGFYKVPADQTSNVWVNSVSGGHRFSAFASYPPADFVPFSGTFPPEGPTTLKKVLPSYLYQEYNDDDNLQGFVAAQNEITQGDVDWFVNIGLPVYTNPLIVGPLLDLVALGIYGMTRPALPSGYNRNIGPYNTFLFNQLDFNQELIIGNQNYYATSDDIFKRILTWHLYKGDGKVFDVQWLKRRIMRFLFGVNGTDPPVDNTYPISVTFGVGGQVNISIGLGKRTVVGGAIYNMMDFNGAYFNELDTTFDPGPAIPSALILKSAIASGALELPFQFTYVVNVA
jgi:hypothetical protein